ncbi:hypothetical protein [Phenylobacterium immobile]|uniref:hypothetical protein n=1 Tax=Phenylobacterium immobile TaxID=21 RepID=UPI000AD77F00|nr:hypothetical protein [Phenylobacterium immobile]
MKIVIAAAATFAALSLTACDRPTGTAPANSEVGAAMPDTAAPRAPDAEMTAPDAAQTGTVPGAGAPAVAETPAEGTAGGQPVTK